MNKQEEQIQIDEARYWRNKYHNENLAASSLRWDVSWLIGFLSKENPDLSQKLVESLKDHKRKQP
jgi:hypothetical protein